MSLLLRRLEGKSCKSLNKCIKIYSPLYIFSVSFGLFRLHIQFSSLVTLSHATLFLPVSSRLFCLVPYSSLVDAGMCSGILVSFRLEQSTTLDSQRHFGGHTGSLLQALFRRVSSVPEQEDMQTGLRHKCIQPHFPMMLVVTHPPPTTAACLQL